MQLLLYKQACKIQMCNAMLHLLCSSCSINLVRQNHLHLLRLMPLDKFDPVPAHYEKWIPAGHLGAAQSQPCSGARSYGTGKSTLPGVLEAT